MFLFLFGLFWTLFTMIFIVTFFVSGSVDIVAFLLILVFLVVGIVMMIIGGRQLIKNYKTNKYGEICYGIIKNVYPDGSYVNNKPEYKADVIVYIESQNKKETITEIIGFHPEKYPEDTFVELKYYEGDINFLKSNLNLESISANAQYILKDDIGVKIEQNAPLSPGVSNGEDIIMVDGVRYKKID